MSTVVAKLPSNQYNGDDMEKVSSQLYCPQEGRPGPSQLVSADDRTAEEAT